MAGGGGCCWCCWERGESISPKSVSLNLFLIKHIRNGAIENWNSSEICQVIPKSISMYQCQDVLKRNWHAHY